MKLSLPVTSIYFLSNLFRARDSGNSNSKNNHDSCTAMHCISDSIEETNYLTEHCFLWDKRCKMVGPAMDKVHQILSEGKVPLFRFKKDDPADGIFTKILPRSTMMAGELPTDQMEFETIFRRMKSQRIKQDVSRQHQEIRGRDLPPDFVLIPFHPIDHMPQLQNPYGLPFDTTKVQNSMLWDEPLEIEVFPDDGSVPYVALSHVWADGLGNVTGNALPACRLPFLRRMLWQSNCPMRLYPGNPVKKEGHPSYGYVDYVFHAEGFDRAYADLMSQPIPAFWIDTFGIPRNHAGSRSSSSKRAALGRMSQTFRDAAKVLVLDNSCVGLAAGAGSQSGNHIENRPVEEVLAFIISSPWMR